MKRFLLQVLLLTFLCVSTSFSEKNKTGVSSKNVIKMLTYNVHHCNPPDKHDVIDIAAIAAVIKQQKADVVALQEIDVNTARSGKINEAEQLAIKAGYKSFFFAKAMDYDGGQYGIAILSKYQLTDTKAYSLPKDSWGNGGEPRMLATATITLAGGKTISIGCTHLEAYNKKSRQLQVEEICRIGEATVFPFIIAGDFNANEGSDVINTLDQHFRRTCNNCPPTFWEEGETGAIDFIAVKPEAAFTVLSHKVVQNKIASDHMPVLAELQLK